MKRCPNLISLIQNDKFCRNETFWGKRACTHHPLPFNGSRCEGNFLGQCSTSVGEFFWLFLSLRLDHVDEAPDNLGVELGKNFNDNFRPECKDKSDFAYQVSLSPTFYELLFCMKVFWTAYMCFQFQFAFFWQKEIGKKAAHKMLVKLTTGQWKMQKWLYVSLSQWTTMHT